MGAFFTNYQIRSTSPDAVRDALKPLAKRAYISPPKNGWVTVYEQQSDSQDDAILRRIAMGLSRKLATEVFAFCVHDSDILIYFLYGRGQLLSSTQPRTTSARSSATTHAPPCAAMPTSSCRCASPAPPAGRWTNYFTASAPA